MDAFDTLYAARVASVVRDKGCRVIVKPQRVEDALELDLLLW
jgi:hypothetical protein